jgi:hypothetical protein
VTWGLFILPLVIGVLLYLRLSYYGGSLKRTAIPLGFAVMSFFLVLAFRRWPDPTSALKSGAVFVVIAVLYVIAILLIDRATYQWSGHEPKAITRTSKRF